MCVDILLENCRKYKNSASEQQTLNIVLENSQSLMQDQVLQMKEDWKREQDLVKGLENELRETVDQLEQS